MQSETKGRAHNAARRSTQKIYIAVMIVAVLLMAAVVAYSERDLPRPERANKVM
jgi:hypothetical protein